mgnify:CR=1 FL=1
MACLEQLGNQFLEPAEKGGVAHLMKTSYFFGVTFWYNLLSAFRVFCSHHLERQRYGEMHHTTKMEGVEFDVFQEFAR